MVFPHDTAQQNSGHCSVEVSYTPSFLGIFCRDTTMSKVNKLSPSCWKMHHPGLVDLVFALGVRHTDYFQIFMFRSLEITASIIHKQTAIKLCTH